MKKTKVTSLLLSCTLAVCMVATPAKLVNAAGNTWVLKSATPVCKAEKTSYGLYTVEGMTIDTDDNNAKYTIQIDGSAGKSALFKNGKIVKNAFSNGEVSTKLEHGNDMAYYKNHLYIAAGSSNRIHRMKRSNGAYTFEKTYTLDCKDKAWNIATYKKAMINGSEKQLFIIGTSGNDTAYLTFKIAYFRDSDNKFITVGNFKVQNPNSNITSNTQANILQGIAFKPDTQYLQICLSNRNQVGNKIVAIKMTMTTGSKTYKKENEVIRTFNVSGKEKFEVESIAVDSNLQYYVAVNEVGACDPIYGITIK